MHAAIIVADESTSADVSMSELNKEGIDGLPACYLLWLSCRLFVMLFSIVYTT